MSSITDAYVRNRLGLSPRPPEQVTPESGITVALLRSRPGLPPRSPKQATSECSSSRLYSESVSSKSPWRESMSKSRLAAERLRESIKLPALDATRGSVVGSPRPSRSFGKAPRFRHAEIQSALLAEQPGPADYSPPNSGGMTVRFGNKSVFRPLNSPFKRRLAEINLARQRLLVTRAKVRLARLIGQ